MARNERGSTSDLMLELKRRGFAVLKHSDRFTAGIPDLSATMDMGGARARGITLWLEVKYLRGKLTLFNELKAIQLVTLQKLGPCAWIVCYKQAGSEVDLYRPRGVSLRPEFAFPVASFGGPKRDAKLVDFLIGECVV